MRKMKNKRKLPDPFFQQRNFFTVWDDSGMAVGTVYVLDSAMMPPRQRGGKQHDPVRGLRRTRRAR
ncbi:hypothetical protein J2Z22_001617 [Paenibacillus forsythiae]|uniref:Uncharacterized protein n=1 Tax=Paenibacillus forsythiae TaxID=365616 RepID=A0ABU3H5J3_9BACL|nr:hypothetical protein [Paenibacillus forsythiae]